MATHLLIEIENLKKKILHIGAVVEENLDRAIAAFNDLDEKKAARAKEKDKEIDCLEVELEEDCLKVIALHQPVAIDLRFIIAVLKINNDLERIGDLAENIAGRALYLSQREKIEVDVPVKEMAQKARRMVEKCLDALVNRDAVLAREVTAADDEIDEMHRQVYKQVEAAIAEYPEHMDKIFCYLSVGRYLERIADHATNIAEDVIYMVDGEIVRHRLGDPCKQS